MGKDHELLEASRTGNKSLVEKLIAAKPSKSSTLAASFGIRVGASVNCQDQRGYTPLHHAALNGHCDIVKLLLQSHASVSIPDDNGSKPLHLAAWNGKADIVLMLLTNGPDFANVNEQNKDKETALHCAAQHGHVDSVKALLDNEADPNIRNIRDESPLDLASQYGRLEVVRLLLTFHPKLLSASPERFTPIHLASRNGHRGVVELLLVHGADINRVGANGTALHEASLFGKIEVVSLLLKRGVNTRAIDSSGRTALELVAQLDTQTSRDIAQLIVARMQEGEDYEPITPVENSSIKQRLKDAKIPLLSKKYLDKFKEDSQIFEEFNEPANIFGPGRAKVTRNISRSFGEADLIPNSQQRGRSSSPTSTSSLKKFSHCSPDTARSVGRFRAGLLRRTSSARSSRSLPRLAPSASYHGNRNTHSFYGFSRKRDKENSFHETSIRQHHPSIDMFPVTPTKTQTKKRSSVSLPSSPQLMSLPHSPVSRGRTEGVPIHDTPQRSDDDNVFFPVTSRPSITFETFLPHSSTKSDQKVLIPLKPPAEDALKKQSASPGSSVKLSIFVQSSSAPPLPKKNSSSEKSLPTAVAILHSVENDQELTTTSGSDEEQLLDFAKRKNSSASRIGASISSDGSSSRSPGAPVKPARSKLPASSSPPPLPPKPAHMMTDSKKHRPPSPKSCPPVDEDISDESSSSNEDNSSSEEKDKKTERKKFIYDSQEDVPSSSALTPPFPSSLYHETAPAPDLASKCIINVPLVVTPVKPTLNQSKNITDDIAGCSLSSSNDKSLLSSTTTTLRSPSPPFSPPSPNTAMQQVSSTLQKAVSFEKISATDQRTINEFEEKKKNIIQKATAKILQNRDTEQLDNESLKTSERKETTNVKLESKYNIQFMEDKLLPKENIEMAANLGKLTSTPRAVHSPDFQAPIVNLTPNIKANRTIEGSLKNNAELIDEGLKTSPGKDHVGSTKSNRSADGAMSSQKSSNIAKVKEETSSASKISKDNITMASFSRITDENLNGDSGKLPKSTIGNGNSFIMQPSQSSLAKREIMPRENVPQNDKFEKKFNDPITKENVAKDGMKGTRQCESNAKRKDISLLDDKDSNTIGNTVESQTQALVKGNVACSNKPSTKPVAGKVQDDQKANKVLYTVGGKDLSTQSKKCFTEPIAKDRVADREKLSVEHDMAHIPTISKPKDPNPKMDGMMAKGTAVSKKNDPELHKEVADAKALSTPMLKDIKPKRDGGPKAACDKHSRNVGGNSHLEVLGKDGVVNDNIAWKEHALTTQVSPGNKLPRSQFKNDTGEIRYMSRRLSLPLKSKSNTFTTTQSKQSQPQSGFKSAEVKRAKICSTRSLAEQTVTSQSYSDYDNVNFSILSLSHSDLPFNHSYLSSAVRMTDESTQTCFPARRKSDASMQTFPPKLKPKPVIYSSNSLDTKTAKSVKKKAIVTPAIIHTNEQSSRYSGKPFKSYPALPSKPKKYSRVAGTNKENETSGKGETQGSKEVSKDSLRSILSKRDVDSSSGVAKKQDASGRFEALSALDGNPLSNESKLDALSVLSLSTLEDWDDALSDRTDEVELPKEVKRYRGLIRGSSLAYRTRLTSCGTRDQQTYDSDEFEYHIDRKAAFSRINASLQADDEIDFPDGKYNTVVTQQAKVPTSGLFTSSRCSPDANDPIRENLMENECCELFTRKSLTQKLPLTKKYSSGEPGEKRRREDELNRKNLLLHHRTVTSQSGFVNHALVTPSHSRDSSYDNNNNNNNTEERRDRNKSDDQKSASRTVSTSTSMTSAPLLPSPMSDGLPDFSTIVETVTAVRKKGSPHESTSGVSSSSSSKSSTLAKQDSGCATLDENDEWAQIANVMKSIGSGLNKGSVYAQEFEETFWRIMTGSDLPRSVESWLSDLSLSQYSKVLCGNGFDDINFLASDILEEQDLIDMNITNESHRRRMLDSAKNLPKIRTLESLETETSSTDGRRMPTSVGDWLRSLCLGDLEETFLMMGFITMDKVRRIKDHEIAVLIHLRGHRKRVQSSLGSSKSSSANKTRSLSQSSNKTTSSRLRSSPPLPRSPLLDKVNFFKDYTQTTTSIVSSTVKSNASAPSTGSYSTGTASSNSSALTNYSSLSDQVVPVATIQETPETTEFKSRHHRNQPSSISEVPTLQHRGRYTSHDSNYPTSPDLSNPSIGEGYINEDQDLLAIAITRLTESNEKNQQPLKNMTTATDQNEIRVPDARRASYLSTTGGELVLRPPNETTSEVEVSSWCHNSEILIKSCCNYQAYYLGSMLVHEVKGVESTVEACAKMKKSTDSMKKIPTVTLSISYKGVKFIDSKSKHEIAEHEIHNISFASQDADDLSTLAYITRDARTDNHYCHVFRVTTLDIAYEIILTLGQAFEVAYQLILKEQALQDGSS